MRLTSFVSLSRMRVPLIERTKEGAIRELLELIPIESDERLRRVRVGARSDTAAPQVVGAGGRRDGGDAHRR